MVETTARHSDAAISTHNVTTDFGVFCLCTECVGAGHMYATKQSAKRHPIYETVGCECEHASHFNEAGHRITEVIAR